LTQLSVFWFEKIREWSADGSLPKINTHFVTADIDKMPEMVRKHREQLEGRSILVRRFNILPIEAIVRGYITGRYIINFINLFIP
jgi:phosphoribosylaminoimidazole-succinocarboxamide synthase